MKAFGRRMWFIATVLGVVAVATPITAAQAQTGKLTGVVTDAESGKPVEGDDQHEDEHVAGLLA